MPTEASSTLCSKYRRDVKHLKKFYTGYQVAGKSHSVCESSWIKWILDYRVDATWSRSFAYLVVNVHSLLLLNSVFFPYFQELYQLRN